MLAVPLRVLVLARRTLASAWNDRVLGLAAEAGFWQLLSLPPLLLAILGTIGYIGDAFGGDAVDSVRQSLLSAADDLLTPSVVDDVVRPTINEILTRGRPDVISIGFLLSLWTGSSAMATYVNTITIAYGQRELRSAVRSRLLALRLYIAQVMSGVILLPALVLGPDLMWRILDADRHHLVDWLLKIAFWPVVAVLSLGMLTSLYHLSLPSRRPWRRALPGALLAMVLWIVGSYLLRLYLETVFGQELIYGSVAAPVAALLFFYVTALAVLLGAELNAAIDEENARSAVRPARTPASTHAPAASAGPADPRDSAGTPQTGASSRLDLRPRETSSPEASSPKASCAQESSREAGTGATYDAAAGPPHPRGRIRWIRRGSRTAGWRSRVLRVAAVPTPSNPDGRRPAR